MLIPVIYLLVKKSTRNCVQVSIYLKSTSMLCIEPIDSVNTFDAAYLQVAPLTLQQHWVYYYSEKIPIDQQIEIYKNAAKS